MQAGGVKEAREEYWKKSAFTDIESIRKLIITARYDCTRTIIPPYKGEVECNFNPF
jgi:hypothetical protein